MEPAVPEIYRLLAGAGLGALTGGTMSHLRGNSPLRGLVLGSLIGTLGEYGYHSLLEHPVVQQTRLKGVMA